MSTNSAELHKVQLRNARIKEIGLIITTVVSLILATLSFFREEREATAKGVYKELAAQNEIASKERVQIQKDLAALRGYMAAKANEPKLFNLFPEEEAKEVAAAPRAGARLTPPIKVGVAKSMPVIAAPAEPERKIPEIKSDPKEYKAPPVEDVAQKAF